MTATLDSVRVGVADECSDMVAVAGRRPAPALRHRTVAIVGLGYVGLPTALSLAEAGVAVIGTDISETRLAAIKSQQVDLLDADHDRLSAFLGSDQLVLTTEASAVSRADTVLVCVPTPVDAHLVPDLTALSAACASVVAHAVAGQTIVLTSTTYVGCTRDLLVDPLQDRGLRVGHDVFVVFSPERIDPGVSSHLPERTPRVVGGFTSECTRRATEVLSVSSSMVHAVSCPEAAELTKLLENTFRAVNVALANEFSDIARQFDIDVMEVIAAAATKPYGFMPFYPGPGVGGHCIPCDPHYLLWQLKAQRAAAPVTDAAMASIAMRPRAVVTRAEQILAGSGQALAGSRVLIVGVAYKPAIADVRESPALEIIDQLIHAGASVAYTDPMVEVIRTAKGQMTSVSDPVAETWDLIIVHTLHPVADYSWIAQAHLILDATYKLDHISHRHIL